MTTVSDIFAWLEATKELEDAMTAAMGAPPSLRSWAHIPDARFHAEVRILKVGERSLTPAEDGQVGQVTRIARLALLARTSPALGGADLPLAMSGSPAVPGGGGDSSSAAGALTPVAETASLGAIKIRLSTVLDQADDTEIKPLTTEELRRLLAEWMPIQTMARTHPKTRKQQANSWQPSTFAYGWGARVLSTSVSGGLTARTSAEHSASLPSSSRPRESSSGRS